MNDSSVLLQRVNIVGCCGAGKTTLGRDLARRLDVPAFDLDELNYLPDWQQRPQTEFQTLIHRVVKRESWLISGNYSRVRADIWARAQTIIWLDYSFFVTLTRLLKRTVARTLRGQTCCNGNRETLRRAFSRESILLWAIQTHAKRRRETSVSLLHPDAAHLQILHFRSPRQTRAWLARL